MTATAWDMTPLMTHSHGTTSTTVATALAIMATEDWCDRCFHIEDGEGGTQLTVAQITLDAYDVDRDRAGSLADCLFTDKPYKRALTLPEPGWYVVTIAGDGTATGWCYAGPRGARMDYDYARSRW